jgi:uncharacterized membrane protein YbjE (DUF340 family)
VLYITVILAAGIMVGFVLREKRTFLDTLEKVVPWIVFALLFFLGISVGLNEGVTRSFSRLGLQAFVISAGGTAGSICLSVPLYRFLFRQKGRM